MAEVFPLGSPSSVIADLTIPGAAYSEVSLSAADFGFSSAILGVVGLSSDGYSFEFDPESSVLKVFQVPAPELYVRVGPGQLAETSISVPGYDPSVHILRSILAFPNAGGVLDVSSDYVGPAAFESIKLSADTSSSTVVTLFVAAAGPSGEIPLGGVFPDLTFRVVAWGF